MLGNDNFAQVAPPPSSTIRKLVFRRHVVVVVVVVFIVQSSVRDSLCSPYYDATLSFSYIICFQNIRD